MNDLAALREAPGEISAWADSRVHRLLLAADGAALSGAAARLRGAGHGNTVSYSRKVFIPLTKLCRDSCHYCTFAEAPGDGRPAYLSADAVLEIARAGERAGCREALFTLGDRPEARYPAARRALDAAGHESTLSLLAEMCALVLKETALLPHVNPGVMSAAEIAALRKVSVSQGLMLESAAERLCERGGPHFGSPDKRPAVRLATIAAAGATRVPFTSGLLIGIGETRAERIDTLLALRRAHREHGHLQEIIVQNFRAKPGTRMAGAVEPGLEDLAWTVAVARLVLGARANIQAPPNLSAGAYDRLLAAGLNDWGGVSPVTPDHVNPEAPWPHLADLAARTERAGFRLVERLAVYPDYVADAERWIDPVLAPRVVRAADSHGFARVDEWAPGKPGAPAASDLPAPPTAAIDPAIARLCDRPGAYDEAAVARLFAARGPDYRAVCAAADELRRDTVGDRVGYVVNRNINYTNICYFKCRFCAFSKGRLSDGLRGDPYDLAVEEVVRRAEEAWQRGATEVCMQGGIHPDYTGDTYVALARAIREALPGLHIHAFSPLEIAQGAETSGRTVPEFLALLRGAGLDTLPGTAAEILDDEVRAVLCPDKIDTAEWLSVMRHAHGAGLRSTATIMFGHMETPASWARHLLRLRALQAVTGGFTEFVPLPFVHMTAPIYLLGRARRGPTFREAVLMHAVARLALHPHFVNVQASWVKMGPEGVAACLAAGANDLGGTLMNESISRAAGTEHGQEMPPERMERLIEEAGREPVQRTTLYGAPPEGQRARAFRAAPLAPVVQTPPARRARRRVA